MMLQRLPEFLAENKAKLLVKYDGERNKNRYTIKLLYEDIRRISIGGDVDSLCSEMIKIFGKNIYFDKIEIEKFFEKVINVGIEEIKREMGEKSVICIRMEENRKRIRFLIHVSVGGDTKHLCGDDYLKLVSEIITR